jgi:hypothetical protein
MYKNIFPKLVVLAGVFAFLFLAATGCKPEKKKGNLKVSLQGYFGTELLNFASIYDAGDGKQYYFSKFKFYLSHIKLVRDDNTEVEIKDAAFFDYGSTDWKSFTVNAPIGNYKAIKLSIGLDPTQNATEPDNFPSTSALGPKEDMYWSWLGHRFVNLEGRGDTIPGNFVTGVGLVYHVGQDTCYRTTTLNNGNFTINANEDKAMTLNVDLKKVFSGSNNPINFYTQPGTQSEAGDLFVAIHFADKFSECFSYSE